MKTTYKILYYLLFSNRDKFNFNKYLVKFFYSLKVVGFIKKEQDEHRVLKMYPKVKNVFGTCK